MNESPSSEASALEFRVDREHGGLRAIILGIFGLGWVVAFFALGQLIPGEGLNLLALFGGFGIAYGVATIAERLLRERWDSGRRLIIDARGVRLALRDQLQDEVMSEDPAEALLWRFTIKRRNRVPKGWTLMACAVTYDGAYVSVYTLISPAQLEAFAHRDDFTLLLADKAISKGSGRDDLRIAGEQRRLRDAEAHRWVSGAEMTFEDFTAFLSGVKAFYPTWITLTHA